MANRAANERLQPCLLDRLTDDEPDQSSEPRERRVLSMAQIRQGVRRDLEWLLNTDNMESTEDLGAFEHVRTSVLNYGITDLAGSTMSSLDAEALEERVGAAIRSFEPRILPDTVAVRMARAADAGRTNAAAFEIEGSLWSQPIPERLYLRTSVDLETGSFSVDREER